MLIEEKIAKLLIKRKKTITIAESCTGGLLSHRLTNISGSSQYFKLGLITYSYESKKKLLKVPRQTLWTYGAVSAEVTTLMAKNVRRILKTDFGIGITGIAGPTGATKTKPIGLTYIALSSPKNNICRRYIFRGNRHAVKRQATTHALKLLLKYL